MKTWTPDTCLHPGCIVEEIYDGPVILGMGQVVRKCAAHQNIADADLYGVLVANLDSEGKRMCAVLRALCGIEGLNLGTDDGAGQLKNGVEYVWSFTGTGAARVLTVQLTGITLSAQKKTTLQNFCDAKFGTGKIVIL